MNIRLGLARIFVPLLIRKRKLKELFVITARALQATEPPLQGLSRKQIIEKYAIFTREKALEILTGDQDIDVFRERLRDEAFQMGRTVRRLLRVSSPKEFMAAARILYRLIGISFRGQSSGRIRIGACYFSRFYSEDVCRFISSLDEGLLVGLSAGGGSLEFSDRLTSGSECCSAVFRFGGEKP